MLKLPVDPARIILTVGNEVTSSRDAPSIVSTRVHFRAPYITRDDLRNGHSRNVAALSAAHVCQRCRSICMVQGDFFPALAFITVREFI